jgi:hypothetical protein
MGEWPRELVAPREWGRGRRERSSGSAMCVSEEPDGPSRTVLLGGHRVLQRWASRAEGASPPAQDRSRLHSHDASRARPSPSQDTPHIAQLRTSVKNKSRTGCQASSRTAKAEPGSSAGSGALLVLRSRGLRRSPGRTPFIACHGRACAGPLDKGSPSSS